MLEGAWRIAHGQWPYRDFWGNYPPGQFVVLAALNKLFGASLLSWRLLRVALDATVACSPTGWSRARRGSAGRCCRGWPSPRRWRGRRRRARTRRRWRSGSERCWRCRGGRWSRARWPARRAGFGSRSGWRARWGPSCCAGRRGVVGASRCARAARRRVRRRRLGPVAAVPDRGRGRPVARHRRVPRPAGPAAAAAVGQPAHAQAGQGARGGVPADPARARGGVGGVSGGAPAGGGEVGVGCRSRSSGVGYLAGRADPFHLVPLSIALAIGLAVPGAHAAADRGGADRVARTRPPRRPAPAPAGAGGGARRGRGRRQHRPGRRGVAAGAACRTCAGSRLAGSRCSSPCPATTASASATHCST